MNIRFSKIYATGLHDSVTYSLKDSVYPWNFSPRTSIRTGIYEVLQEIRR